MEKLELTHSMRQVRVKHDTNFTTVSNDFIRDIRLSLKGKGLLLTILSLNDNEWDFSINGMCAILKESKTAVYSAIDELIDLGYCIREQFRDEISGCMLPMTYTFYEHPCKKQKPLAENPNADNDTQLSIDILEDNISTVDNYSKDKDNNSSTNPSSLSTSQIPYDQILKLWNETCTSLNALTTLTSKRKEKIRLRWKEFAEIKAPIDVLKTIFIKLQASTFVTKQSNTNWRKNCFNWLFENSENWVKVYEGNYDDTQQSLFPTVKETKYDDYGHVIKDGLE